MTKIFATGVTGYIGGDALFAIANAHPEYEITCLVRNSDKGAQVAKDYPKFTLVYGDLDKVDLIEQESKKADIVLNFAYADHVPAANAIIKGLAEHEPSKPGFFIHTSGTGILMIEDYKAKRFGEASDTIYDDVKDIGGITSMPDEAPHRVTDKIVLAAGPDHTDRIKSVVVCPPTIYGVGRGTGNQRSVQIPDLIKATLQKGHGIKVNAGKAIWSHVHVHDLSDLYLKLVENAASGGSLAEWPGKPALWGSEAYFFAESGEHVWGDISQTVAAEAQKQGFLKTDEVKSLSAEEAGAVRQHGQGLWGCNCRSRASRAREALKWKPSGPTIEDEMKAAVEIEAKNLGLKPCHALVAAGDA